jgi:hypothetical protein
MKASKDSEVLEDIQFGGPATYRIVVQGKLGQNWSDRLAGMTITTVERGERAPHTVLEGRIRDQAQLSGVLDALYGLRLPLVSVEDVGSAD